LPFILQRLVVHGQHLGSLPSGDGFARRNVFPSMGCACRVHQRHLILKELREGQSNGCRA
jgi:hypothetical protein